MNRNWAAQKALHPSTTNQLIESAFAEAMAKGAVTGKALGAGGGGCIYFCCQPGTRNAVAEAVKKTGCEILTFDFDFRGLTFEKS